MGSGSEQYPNNQSIGETLRLKREELHLSLEDISQKLRIRLIFLQALEEGKIDQLPGIAYASGFLRSYADFLDLNSEELIKRFHCEYQGTEYKQKLLFPAPVPQSGVPAAVFILAGFLIIAGGYISWYKITDHRKVPAETIPSFIDQKDEKQMQEKISPQIASVMPSQKLNDVKSDADVIHTINKLENQIAQSQKSNESFHEVDNVSLKQEDLPQKSDSSQKDKPNINSALSAENSTENNNSVSVNNNMKIVDNNDPQNLKNFNNQESNQSTALSKEEQKSDKVNKTEHDIKEMNNTDIIIKASDDSWLKVQNQQGHVLLQKTLKKGENWTIPVNQQNVIMTIGNAGAIMIQSKGKQSKVLGEKGRVLRHFVITPELLEKIITEPVK